MSELRQAATKVPLVAGVFWLVKILTTGMGEATSDFLAHGIGPIVAVPIGGAALVAALAWQLAVRRYEAWPYWTAVAMVSVFGTMAADALHVGLGIPYVVSSVFFALVLTAIFYGWHRTEGTLSIHSIRSRRRELFYWATVLATFALGTAVGDMTATTLHLGYLASGFLFAVLIAIPAVAYWKLGLNAVVAFWWAYVLTRPLGASFADWLAVPRDRGGLDLGYGTVSLALALLIMLLVAYLAIRRPDVERVPGEPITAPESQSSPRRST